MQDLTEPGEDWLCFHLIVDIVEMVEEKVPGGAVSRLIIRQVKMNDSAQFGCLAENSYGRANTSIVLIVEVRTQ